MEAASLRKRFFSNILFFSLEAVSKGLAENQGDVKKNEGAKKDVLKQMMEDAKTRASQYGPTVKFVSVTPAKVAGLTGYKAIYSFDDINTARINQNPGDKRENLRTAEVSLTRLRSLSNSSSPRALSLP